MRRYRYRRSRNAPASAVSRASRVAPVRVKDGTLATNCAVTMVSASIVTAHVVELPSSHPVQPAKSYVELGFAVRTTVSSRATSSVQSAGQSMPLPDTVPSSVVAMITSSVVSGISRLPSGEVHASFRVRTRPADGAGEERHLDVDFVAVCNGVFSVPNVPPVPGIDHFPGRVLHSSQLTDEIAAHWLSQHFRGELELPGRAAMEEEIRRVERWAGETFHPVRGGYFIGPHMSHYVDELVADMELPLRRTSLIRESAGRFLPERSSDLAQPRRRRRDTE